MTSYFCERAPRHVTDESELLDTDYWEGIVQGELQIGSDLCERSPLFELSDAEIERLRSEANTEGYIHLGAAQLPWASDISKLARAVTRLLEAGWDPIWLLIYDETWLLSWQLSAVLSKIFGNDIIFDFYAWYVDPRASQAGWGPHRDRGESDPVTSFRPDGTAKMNTIWIPLTDATPDNSCLYVLPASSDKRYRDAAPADASAIFSGPSDFQNIRSIPAAAGSAVMFTHRLLHWGSKSKKNATSPRIAISYAASSDDFEKPYFPRSMLPSPPLETRVALAAGQMLVYFDQVKLPRNLVEMLYSVFMFNCEPFDATYQRKVQEAFQSARLYNVKLDAEARSDVPPATVP